VGIKIATIVATRYNSKIVIPLLLNTHQIMVPQKQPLAVFGVRFIQDQIVMEHVNFLFLQSYVSLKFF
jgi:hypothetical protein